MCNGTPFKIEKISASGRALTSAKPTELRGLLMFKLNWFTFRCSRFLCLPPFSMLFNSSQNEFTRIGENSFFKEGTRFGRVLPFNELMVKS